MTPSFIEMTFLISLNMLLLGKGPNNYVGHSLLDICPHMQVSLFQGGFNTLPQLAENEAPFYQPITTAP